MHLFYNFRKGNIYEISNQGTLCLIVYLDFDLPLYNFS